MTSSLQVAGFLAMAGAAGALAGRGVCSSVTCRNAIGLTSQRGALVAMVEGVGVYECDIARAQAEWSDRNPHATDEPDPAVSAKVADAVIANLRAERFGQGEEIAPAAVDCQLELAKFQFQPKAWLIALRSDGLTPESLRSEIAQSLRAQSWIEKKIHGALTVGAEECAAYYQAHPLTFTEPFRIRVRHIFFAAPPGSNPELTEAKRQNAEAIVDRIDQGEKFTELVVNSEDERSKKLSGDLGFFSESRAPVDFWNAVKGMPVGAPVAVIRTTLGFHVVEVIDSRWPRQISLEEARPEIVASLENERRGAAVDALTAHLKGKATER